MLKDILNDYFSFTRKERIAILLLLFLITVVLLLPYLIPAKQRTIDKKSLKEFELQMARLKTVKVDTSNDSSSGSEVNASYHNEPGTTNDYLNTSTLFYFDPNTLSIDGWKKLGINERTINTIRNYLSKGGRFRRAEDIGKIYGMQRHEVKKLLPYIRIKVDTSLSKNRTYDRRYVMKRFDSGRSDWPASKYSTSFFIDVNTADTSAFIALPGIGSKLASRIINFREKLGGFYSIEQLSEVYGIADSIFRNIKPRLKISAEKISLINVNTSSIIELKQHPYLRQNLASAIVEYRLQHGMYKSKEDLKQIDIITPEVFNKISPYVSL